MKRLLSLILSVCTLVATGCTNTEMKTITLSNGDKVDAVTSYRDSIFGTSTARTDHYRHPVDPENNVIHSVRAPDGKIILPPTKWEGAASGSSEGVGTAAVRGVSNGVWFWLGMRDLKPSSINSGNANAGAVGGFSSAGASSNAEANAPPKTP